MITIGICLKCIHTELLSRKTVYDSAYSINPYDQYMLRNVVAFKHVVPVRVIGVTMGPLECIAPLKRCLAFGVDRIYLINDACLAGSDTYATSYILSEAFKSIGGIDMYAFGEKSLDGETSQVPIGVASRLDLPYITGVKRINIFSDSCTHIKLDREFMGSFECLLQQLPFVASFKGSERTVCVPHLLNIKKSQTEEPIILTADALNLNREKCGKKGSKTNVIGTIDTVFQRNSTLVEGTLKDKAKVLQMLLS